MSMEEKTSQLKSTIVLFFASIKQASYRGIAASKPPFLKLANAAPFLEDVFKRNLQLTYIYIPHQCGHCVKKLNRIRKREIDN